MDIDAIPLVLALVVVGTMRPMAQTSAVLPAQHHTHMFHLHTTVYQTRLSTATFIT